MLEDKQTPFLPNITKYITPPNPIIEKTIQEPTPSKRPLIDLDSDEDNQPFDQADCLLKAYKPTQMIFMKWKDRNTVRNNIDYFASHFFQRFDKDKFVYQGHTIQDTLVFNSDIESGNLLAVFKVGQNSYDLVLQNDTNSSGYTQWFNFAVSNRNKLGTIHFNIYKKESLFREGMKPLTKSLVHDKNWKRSCHKVEYYINQLKMEGRKKKYYKTLSFNYDFIFSQDTVQFSYVYPYCYERLFNWIKDINSPKVPSVTHSQLKVKFLGATPLKKIIMMLHITSGNFDERLPKRGIVIMGRQHSGQTPSSFVIESIVEELLGSSQQNTFLLSKFDFYIFPMVNVDGVVLGNYRCNMAGYDLNRYWHLDQCKSIPEVCYIKNQIKKIMKKTDIQMILDIHGHSSQMNSFFYGNNFGKYNMIFPYVASKIEPFIQFGSSSFSEEEGDKSKTARVILGNMIKETGSVYTFQISLFGYTKNGKKIPFLIDHFQQMGRSLLSAMNKCEVEIYKQQKGLRESLYLKQIRKQLRRAQGKVISKEEACSDTEAKTTTLIEEKAKQKKLKYFLPNSANDKNEINEKIREFVDFGVQNELLFNQSEYDLMGIVSNQPKMIRAKKMIYKIEKRQDQKNLSFSNKKREVSPENYKEFLLNKLQIYGSTFSENNNSNNKSLLIAQTAQKPAQTNYTIKMLKKREQQLSPRSNFVNNSTAFYGTSLRKIQVRDKSSFREKKSRSYKSGIDSVDLNFQGILKFGKVIL